MRSLLLFFLLYTARLHAQDVTELALQACQAKPQIIGLGESAHNDDAQHLYKLALLEAIHKQHSVSTLLFESPFTDAALAFIDQKSYDAFVYPFWKTKTIYPGLSAFINHNHIKVGAFDPQENCRFRDFNQWLVSRNYIDASVTDALLLTDSLLSIAVAAYPGAKTRPLTDQEAGLLITAQDKLINNLQQIKQQDRYTPLLLRCLENRKQLARLLSFTSFKDKIKLRDQVMAENCRFLLQYFNTGANDLTVIWTANRHIAKDNAWGRKWATSGVSNMADNLSATGALRLYSIGIAPSGSALEGMHFDLTASSGKKIPIAKEAFNNYNCRP